MRKENILTAGDKDKYEIKEHNEEKKKPQTRFIGKTTNKDQINRQDEVRPD